MTTFRKLEIEIPTWGNDAGKVKCTLKIAGKAADMELRLSDSIGLALLAYCADEIGKAAEGATAEFRGELAESLKPSATTAETTEEMVTQ